MSCLSLSWHRMYASFNITSCEIERVVILQDNFKDGITNGNAWYSVYGSLQDWVYIMGHCLELTLELWEDKYPEGTNLTSAIQDNKAAALQYPILAVFCGVRGTVTNIVSNAEEQPVSLRATLTIKGAEPTSSECFFKNEAKPCWDAYML